MKNKQSLLAEFEKKYNKKFVCKRPFELVELDMWGNLYLCFPRCNNKSYKAGNLYKLRGLKTASCDCYQIILENFSETPFAIKARRELEDMGIKIEIPQDNVEEDEEE